MPIDRRHFLAGAAALGAVSVLPPAFAADSDLRVNADRLRQTLEALSVFGRPQGGSFADGVSRVAYSDADVAGRKYALGLIRQAGLEPRVDTAGNIHALRSGQDSSLPEILFGSHIDSVPSGGNFDGDVGSLSAIEVLRTLNDRGIKTRRPLHLAIWQNEEGGVIGSTIAAGEFPPASLQHVSSSGLTIEQGIRKIGGDPTRLQEARIPKGSFRAYLELHIEQGGNLAKAGIPVGVVEGIVSIDEYDVTIRGFANHAGTTPMPERRNALLAAAKLIETVQQVVTAEPGRQVGTVGHIDVLPNARNVVPGLVKCSVELRDLSDQKIARLGEQIQARAQQIAKDTGTEIEFQKVEHDPPAVATPEIQSLIEKASAALGLKTMRLPSGAGHDAQMMARLGPIGMIFVPSQNGISHSPKELTLWPDVANGANVLLQTILLLDSA
ncbi:MAG TPA: Zn-dependent hydrolase [Terriglobales bacterium]|nr:Zn-dependent hydrolase [Terriglobales bacterium]